MPAIVARQIEKTGRSNYDLRRNLWFVPYHLDVLVAVYLKRSHDFLRDWKTDPVAASAEPTADEKRFGELCAVWRTETRLMSSPSDIAMHPAYQQIIGMGERALPFIFRELRRAPAQWFWALRAITGLDAVQPADRGNVRKMAEAWLRWAKGEGYVDLDQRDRPGNS